jgi:hypothetical protein
MHDSDANASIIFLLTSLFIDSIHSISATNHRCKQSIEKWKGRIETMAAKKKAKKKKKH